MIDDMQDDDDHDDDDEDFSPVTCTGAQLEGSDYLTLLASEEVDDGFYHSGLIRAQFDGEDVSLALAVDYQTWLTCFWKYLNSYVLFGTIDGYVIHQSAQGATLVKLSDRAITAFVGSPSGSAFAVCMDGSAHSWDGSAWSRMSGFNEIPLLDAIVHDGRLYACGDEGTLIRHETGAWTRIPLPTNQNMTCLLAKGESLYIGGRQGAVFCLRDDEIVDVSVGSGNVHGMANFQGDTYLAASDAGLLRFEGGPISLPEGFIPFGVTASEKRLVTYSGSDVGYFDGEHWLFFSLENIFDTGT
jgi:hypothetical protein